MAKADSDKEKSKTTSQKTKTDKSGKAVASQVRAKPGAVKGVSRKTVTSTKKALAKSSRGGKLTVGQTKSVAPSGEQGPLAYPVMNLSGKQVGTIDLDPIVFDAPIRADIVHSVITWQRNRWRAGTHSTLTKGVMKGGGKKPWKQKGTGRARAGSSTSPIWVGGAVAHGPLPRSYETRVTKRARRQALGAVLSDKRVNSGLVILDDTTLSAAKTREFVNVLKALGIDHEKAVLVVSNNDDALARASRNVPNVKPLPVEGLNVYDLVCHPLLICSKADIESIQARVIEKNPSAESNEEAKAA